MEIKYLVSLDARRLPRSIGVKARNISLLKNKGFLVPKTHICTWEAYQGYLNDDAGMVARLATELAQVINPQDAYAVRSFANIEDGVDFSFAGQFKTVLNAQGTDAVIQAIWSIWATARSERVRTYLEKVYGRPHELLMAVIIQDMVAAQVSGVAFSKNPITGLDEVIVEAVRGSGERLVQEGVTPLRWVKKWETWLEQPEDEKIPQSLIDEVVQQTLRIARTFGKEVDLEWVYDGKDLYWVQMRDITSLQPGNIYSNRISKEMIPGQIKPLVWSISIPVHSHLWRNLIGEMIGKHDLDLSDLVHAFHYQAYFNMGAFGKVFHRMGMPRESLEIMMGLVPPGVDKPRFKPGPGMMRLVPTMTHFILDKWRFARQVESKLPELERELGKYSFDAPVTMEEDALLTDLERLHDYYQQTAHYTLIVQLLMFLYTRIFRSQLEKTGLDFQQFDLTEGMPELERFNPDQGLIALQRTISQLDPALQERLRCETYADLHCLPELADLRAQLEKFIEQFGHHSASENDFSVAPWRETPDVVLKMAADYQRPQITQDTRLGWKDVPAKGVSRWMLQIFYRRARQFRLYREACSSLFAFTINLLRVYYLALGERLVLRKALDQSCQIFYLYEPEIRQVIDGQLAPEQASCLANQREEEMRRCRGVVLPEVIYGDTPPMLIASQSKNLHGVPTSRGYYSGRVKVVKSYADFGKLEKGDVLVIPYSEVGWVPLFAKAGAVIAESGGMLSHSSIIAREYHIPAVVSVQGALTLRDNTLVSVDGFKGLVAILEE